MSKTYDDKEFIKHLELFKRSWLPALHIEPGIVDGPYYCGHKLGIFGGVGFNIQAEIRCDKAIPQELVDDLFNLLLANNSFVQKWSYFYKECKECQKRKAVEFEKSCQEYEKNNPELVNKKCDKPYVPLAEMIKRNEKEKDSR